jgi:D-beta-D-heptose 7-phosphate kinase/D-beta-D-heptose 1-phosphate adenosyltransferase
MSDCETYIENFLSTGWDGFISNANLRRHVRESGEQLRGGVSSMGIDKEQHNNRAEAEPAGETGMAESEGKVANAGIDSRQFRVAVIGDFMTDIYHIGEASSLSAEVPIPVVKVKETKAFPGGAGNVAANLHALGCKVLWFSGSGTPLKHRLMVGDHQLARWDDFDECRPVSGLNRLVGVDAIVVADYGKGSVDEFVVEYVKRHVGVPVFVDTKRDPSVWSGVAVAIFPNEKEYDQFTHQYDTSNIPITVLKKGEKGLALIRERNDKKWQVDAIAAGARFIRSVNGAGDSVIAAFVYKWLAQMQEYAYHEEGRDYQELLEFANTAAAIAVENPMTYAPTLEEVQARFYGK